MTAAPTFDVARVSVAGLVALKLPAAALPLGLGPIQAPPAGRRLSTFKGRGMEFAETRPYQAGDDIRSLDWRVTARTGKPHTKLFREERERPMFLWVDYRTPMFFATRGTFKAVAAARLAGLLAWGANHHGDRIGGLVFSEHAHHESKPMPGQGATLRFIKELAAHPAWQAWRATATEPGAGNHALARLRRLVRPGSLVFLISDFREIDASGEAHLIQLGCRSEVTMILVHDPLESHLPPRGRYRLSDGRTNVVLDTGSPDLRGRYEERFERHCQRLHDLARHHGFRLWSCGTSDDPLKVLMSGLGTRPMRRG